MTMINSRLLAVTVAAAAFVSSLHAQPYLRGTFNGWSLDTPMNANGDGTYSVTIDQYSTGVSNMTAGTQHDFKVDETGDWSSAFPGSDARTVVDASGEITVHFYPGLINDGWRRLSDRVGYVDPQQFGWEIIGSFNNWTSEIRTAERQMTNNGSGLYSVDYTFTNAPGTYEFKFRESNSWNISIGGDFGNSAGNISVTTTQANQTVTIQLDLPNGRYLVGEPLPAVTNQVSFVVNMEVPIAIGETNYADPNAFTPDYSRLFVRGSFNDWSTNANCELFQVGSSTLYSNTVDVPAYQGETIYYRFYAVNPDTDPVTPGEESPLLLCGNARSMVITNSSLSAPPAYWSDRMLSDQVSAITFQVDMSVQKALGAFDELSDTVYVRGVFNNWMNNLFPDPAWQLYQVGSSLVYSNTFQIAAPIGGNICYKFFGNTQPDWENDIPNREFIQTNASVVLPLVYFNDMDMASACPYVTYETNWVTFTVDMTDAVTSDGSNVYNGTWDVYINGTIFENQDWKPWTTNDLADYKLTQSGANYSIQLPMAPGKPLRMQYAYGAFIPILNNTNSLANESAGFGEDHVRWIRTTPGETNYSVFDVWTGTNAQNIANLVEPQMSLSANSSGPDNVVISYWSLPCAELQVSTSVTGQWNTVSYDAVDVGSTNVPTTTSEQEYFRLFMP